MEARRRGDTLPGVVRPDGPESLLATPIALAANGSSERDVDGPGRDPGSGRYRNTRIVVRLQGVELPVIRLEQIDEDRHGQKRDRSHETDNEGGHGTDEQRLAPERDQDDDGNDTGDYQKIPSIATFQAHSIEHTNENYVDVYISWLSATIPIRGSHNNDSVGVGSG